MREATNNEYPRWAIWENVPGAFSSNKGYDFRTVLEEINESEIPMPENGKWATAGMVELFGRQTAWRVLDAQFWGVPQRRKRIFLVTDFRGTSAVEILFKPESLFGDFAESREAREGIADGFENSVDGASRVCGVAIGKKRQKPDACYCKYGTERDVVLFEPRSQDGVPRIHGNVSPTLNTAQGGQRQPCVFVGHGIKTNAHAHRKNHCRISAVDSVFGFCPDNSITAGGVGLEEEKTATLSTTKRMGVAIACSQRDEVRGINDCTELTTYTPSGFADYREGVGTLKANGGDLGGGSCGFCNKCFAPAAQTHTVRRLTPKECERLQGFPDGWTEFGFDGKAISDTKRYAALGNSVAIPCVEYIMSNIARVHCNIK